MSDFVADFNPERGDLMYGIRDARTVYVSKWQEHISQNMERVVNFLKVVADGGKPNWNIIDNYNDYFFLGGNMDFSSSSSYSKAVGELYSRLGNVCGGKTIDKSSTWKSQTQLLQRTAYVHELEHSRFSPIGTLEAPAAKLNSEGFTAANSGNAEGAQKQNRSYLAIRRACKFGIAMVASDMAFAGCKVHFVLDGQELQQVAQKTPRVGYGGRTAVSITTSEVRYVFRNWDKLKSTVTFYVNLKSVAAPWEQDWSLEPVDKMPPNPIKAYKSEWDTYAQQRVLSGKAAVDKSLY